MLLGFEHVNLVASNMDRTLAFYVGLLGLTLRVRRRTDSGGEVAFVDTPGGGMEIVSPPGPVATPARLVPRTEAGIGHIAFTVDDVDAEYERLSQAGVPFRAPPRLAVNSDVLHKVAFCSDPDGVVVELCQRPA